MRSRRLFTLCSALSLLLCIASCVLWVRSYRATEAKDRWGTFVAARAARFTLLSDHGRLTLFRPPAAPPPTPSRPPPQPPRDWAYMNTMGRLGLMPLPAGITPEQLVGQIRNDQIAWDVCRRYRDWFKRTSVLMPAEPFFSPRGRPGTAAQVLAPFDPLDEFEETYDRPPNPARHQPFPAAAVTPPLLLALEDPTRWVAAHVLLRRIHDYSPYDGNPRNGRRRPIEGPPDGPWVYPFGGLDAELHPAGEAFDWTDDASDGEYWRVTGCAAAFDPDQQAAVRELWHRRLDVPVTSVPQWAAVATGLLPSWWVAAALFRARRTRLRRRSNRCMACGYDLRASAGRCPECVAAAPSAGVRAGS